MTKAAIFAVAALGAFALFGAAKVSVTELTLPTYGYDDPDPVPRTDSKFWPYCRSDGFTATASNRTWTAVVLENDEMKLTILPEVGGKIWGAEEKKSGQDFIYFNHAVKFRDIAMCGPWTSGGIEFNFGIVGHGPYTSLPVDWCVRENDDGSVSYFCGLTEMICRTTWQVEVRLPASGREFETRTVWFNGSGLRRPYYQWMNAGFGVKRENPEYLFPGRNYIGHEGDAHPWPLDEEGRDISVYSNNAFGVSWFSPRNADHKSYHIINGDNRFFGVWWPKAELGAYHFSETDQKYGRKIWLWGLSRAGGIWEDLLTDADGQYVDLQSGRVFQQPQDVCWKTPFAYPTFVPGTTDVFVEKWGFVRDRADLEKRAKSEIAADRPTEFPEDFDWNGAYGLWMKAQAAIFAGLRQGGVRKGLYKDDAERLLRESLAKDPCFSKSLVTLGGLLTEFGRFEEAVRVLDKALAVNTYEPEANYLEGLVAFETGKLPRARERLGLAAYSPEFRAAALTLVAKSHAREGNWRLAGDTAARALAANAEACDALWLLGVSLRKTGQVEAARQIIASALKDFPLFHAFRYEAVKLGLERDYKVNVRNHAPNETYLETAGLYESAGLGDEAEKIYGSAANSVVAAIRAAYLGRDVKALARVAGLSVRFAFPWRLETLPALRWASENGNSWKFDYLLALFLNAKLRTTEGDVLLEKCADRPDEAEFYLYRASRRTGAAARADLRAAAAIADSWRVGLAHGRTFAEEGNWASARDVFKGYLARTPENPGLQIAYARALVKTGAHAEAVKFLERINFLPSELGERPLPLYQEALVTLADGALAKGDEKSAAEFVRKALNPPETLGSGRPFSWAGVIAEWPARVRDFCEKKSLR